MAITAGEEAAIREALRGTRSVDRTYRVELVDKDGVVHAEVDKVVHVRLRYNAPPTPESRT